MLAHISIYIYFSIYIYADLDDFDRELADESVGAFQQMRKRGGSELLIHCHGK
jgi:hypothetical protein